VSRLIPSPGSITPREKAVVTISFQTLKSARKFSPGKFVIKNVKLQVVVFIEIDANKNTLRKKRQTSRG